ncbi:hypothetical protein ACQX2F_06380, partial [Corynebacterium diphtheriae]
LKNLIDFAEKKLRLLRGWGSVLKNLIDFTCGLRRAEVGWGSVLKNPDRLLLNNFEGPFELGFSSQKP